MKMIYIEGVDLDCSKTLLQFNGAPRLSLDRSSQKDFSALLGEFSSCPS